MLILLLSAHAMGTEFLQRYVETRTPTLHDVGLDHMGIMLGLALSWRMWRGPVAYSTEPA
jgi:hypothetical protein